MNITGWKKNLLLVVGFVVYLLLGSAIFYGIENDAPPPPPDRMTMLMMKVMSEKQMNGIHQGMTKMVPHIAMAYKGQTGKENFDEKDVSTIVEMSMEKVMEMVKAEMAKAMGGNQGPPQASKHMANGHDHDAKSNGENEANVPETQADQMVTEDKTMTEGSRRKRQADNSTETDAMTTEAPTEATTPSGKKEQMSPPKPGFGSFVYLLLSGFSTVGYGNLYPKTCGGQIFFMLYTTAGIPLFFYVICKIVLAMRASFIFVHAKMLTALNKEATSTRVKNVTRFFLAFIVGFVVLMLMCAAIFSHVEDWTYMHAFYFTYQTVTTIGFGDFAPGLMMGLGNPMEVNSSVRGIYMVFVFIYMFFGISWFFTLGLMILDCCKGKHQTKEITQKNGVSTPPKITVESDVEKNDDLEKTATPLLNDSTKEDREMEEISINKEEKEDEKPAENEDKEKATETA